MFLLNASFKKEQVKASEMDLYEEDNIIRSSRSQMSLKIGVLKKFTIFTGKHLCWSLFFNKAAGLQVCNFTQKRLLDRCLQVCTL